MFVVCCILYILYLDVLDYIFIYGIYELYSGPAAHILFKLFNKQNLRVHILLIGFLLFLYCIMKHFCLYRSSAKWINQTHTPKRITLCHRKHCCTTWNTWFTLYFYYWCSLCNRCYINMYIIRYIHSVGQQTYSCYCYSCVILDHTTSLGMTRHSATLIKDCTEARCLTL